MVQWTTSLTRGWSIPIPNAQVAVTTSRSSSRKRRRTRRDRPCSGRRGKARHEVRPD